MIRESDILAHANALPPLPGSALRIMQVARDPNASGRDIIDTVRYDPAVTTALLRLCNSAACGLSRRISSLDEALVYLGTVKVVELVLVMHAGPMLSAPQPGYGLERGALWRHSVATAIASAEFARRFGLGDVGLAFTGGLLHDIGKLVLSQFVAADFERLIGRVQSAQMSFSEAEAEILGFSHAEIGAKIAERWSLPDPIVRCIRHHQAPKSAAPTDPYVDAVYLGNCVCLILGIGLGEDGLACRADRTVLARHSLAEADLESVALETLSGLERVSDLLGDAAVVAAAGPAT